MFINSEKREIRFTVLLFDILVTVFSFALSYFIRQYIISNAFLFDMQYYTVLLIIILLTWFIMLRTPTPLPSLPNNSMKDVAYDVIKRVSIGTAIVIAITFLMKGVIVSRLFILMFSFINTVLLILERKLYLMYKINRFRKGNNLVNIVVIGNNDYSRNICGMIRSHRDWGIKLVEQIDPDTLDDDSFINRLKTMHVDFVIFSVAEDKISAFNPRLQMLVESGIETMVYLEPILRTGAQAVKFDSFLGMDFIRFSSKYDRSYSIIIKYYLDILSAALLLLILSPFMAAIALLIVLLDGKPIIFTQERVGLNGKTFTMFKFRTMMKDAERYKRMLTPLNDMDGPVFKIKDDPRITKLGRILRRFSIDELPQLWNVLKGEMSIVGPRPPLPSEITMYKLWQRRRLSMKPGLTCTWQISGRNKIDFTKWMYMDLEYIDHWSLLYDIIIVMKTIPAVITGKGAV